MRLLIIVLTGCFTYITAQPPHVVSTVYGTGSGIDYVTTIEYSDGLSRPLQSCTFSSGTINTYTLYSGTYYDLAGRNFLSALPFADQAAGISYIPMNQAAVAGGTYSGCSFMNRVLEFYNSASGRNAEGYPFSQTAYYEDPLNRVRSSGSPGRPFSLDPTAGHPSKIWYLPTALGLQSNSNVDTAGFIKKSVFANLDNLSASNIQIANPTHFLTVTMNPDGKYSQSISDQFGNVVKTWADPEDYDERLVVSSSKYDLLGRVLEETAPRESNPTLNTTPSKYKYSTDGSIISKITPDAGEVLYKYDMAGRLKCVQDEISRASEGSNYMRTYLVYNYDKLGRVRECGLNNINISFVNLGSSVLDNDIALDVKAKYFYDNQNGISDLVPSGLVTTISKELKNLRGNLVASVSYDESGSKDQNHRVVKLYTYDDENRLKADYLIIGSENVVRKTVYTYSILGNVTALDVYHDYPSTTARDQFVYTYDHSDRPDKVYVNDKLKISYQYDQLGRLIGKDFYNNQDVPQSIKHITYSYTVQGWLKKSSTGDGAFQEELFYDNIVEAGFGSGTPLYTGNISAVKATQNRFEGTDFNTGFVYGYDGINRLKSVTEKTGKTEYHEAFAYRKDGRLLEKYTGRNATDGSQQYSYNAGKNQLNYIDRSSTKGQQDNFLYDKNGNMIADLSKKMIVEYDWRNMPVRFSFFSEFPSDRTGMKNNASTSKQLMNYMRTKYQRVSFAEMVYDADGNRVKKAEFGD